MGNFSRAIQLALRHRLTVLASLLCSLAVAILWAANIATVLPVVDGVMQGKSIPQLFDETIAAAETTMATVDRQAQAVRDQLPSNPPTKVKQLQRELRTLQQQRTKAQAKKDFWQWFQPAAHRWLPTTPFETLAVVCLALFVGTFLKSLFRIAGFYFMARLGQLTEFELRKQFYRRTLHLDLATFRQTSPGDLMNRFTGEISYVAAGTQSLFGAALREPLKMLACLAMAACVSWQLLLLTVISAPLAGYAIHWLTKALKRANRRAQEEFSAVFDLLEETFSSIKVIKAFTRESRERGRFHQTSKQYYRRSMKIAMYNSLVSPTTEIMGIGMIVAAMLAGGYLVLTGQTHLFGLRISSSPLTHGMMGLFFGSLAGASDPVRRMSGVLNGLQRAAAASDRVYALLDRESQVIDPPTPVPLPQRLGRIQFHDVSFAYQASEPVLHRINFQIPCGETIAVMGPNGCGKSTLMNMLARFYDPTAGAITLDGMDLRHVRLRELRSRIGLVTQETLLFDDTVTQNICYGQPTATFADIEQAARQAHAHQFITEQLADGYASRCGPGGNRLSGGQRQRIALARAILRDPEILILDEATSQIDVESEQLIHEVSGHGIWPNRRYRPYPRTRRALRTLPSLGPRGISRIGLEQRMNPRRSDPFHWLPWLPLGFLLSLRTGRSQIVDHTIKIDRQSLPKIEIAKPNFWRHLTSRDPAHRESQTINGPRKPVAHLDGIEHKHGQQKQDHEKKWSVRPPEYLQILLHGPRWTVANLQTKRHQGSHHKKGHPMDDQTTHQRTLDLRVDKLLFALGTIVPFDILVVYVLIFCHDECPSMRRHGKFVLVVLSNLRPSAVRGISADPEITLPDSPWPADSEGRRRSVLQPL